MRVGVQRQVSDRARMQREPWHHVRAGKVVAACQLHLAARKALLLRGSHAQCRCLWASLLCMLWGVLAGRRLHAKRRHMLVHHPVLITHAAVRLLTRPVGARRPHLAGVGAGRSRHSQPQAAQLPRRVAAHHHAPAAAQVCCLAGSVALLAEQSSTRRGLFTTCHGPCCSARLTAPESSFILQSSIHCQASTHRKACAGARRDPGGQRLNAGQLHRSLGGLAHLQVRHRQLVLLRRA